MQSAYCSLTGEFTQKQTAEQINYPKLKYVQNKPLTPPPNQGLQTKISPFKEVSGSETNACVYWGRMHA